MAQLDLQKVKVIYSNTVLIDSELGVSPHHSPFGWILDQIKS